MIKHRSKLLNWASALGSREAGFVFAALGVSVQAFHTYYITMELSSLEGIMKIIQAVMMALFISCALLYFTLKSSDDDNEQAAKYRKLVMWFAIVESFINLYYWASKLIFIPWPKADWGSFTIAIPLSILLPVILKSYGSEIRIDEPSIQVENAHNNLSVDQVEQIKIDLGQLTDNFKSELSDRDQKIQNLELELQDNLILDQDKEFTMTFINTEGDDRIIPVKLKKLAENSESIENLENSYQDFKETELVNDDLIDTGIDPISEELSDNIVKNSDDPIDYSILNPQIVNN